MSPRAFSETTTWPATNTRSYIVFYLNGRRVEVRDAQPRMTLIEYLRSVECLTGTKLGCGEGGCGACTVTLSCWQRHSDSYNVVHRSVNACLAPLCAVDSCHVTTVEGIGSKSDPHPVQDRIAKCHGSQCGFCTPGIVMALYSKLLNNPSPSLGDMEEAFDGNLCRCTGYRPILDAAKSFAVRADDECPRPEGVTPTPSGETGCSKTDVVSTTASKLERLGTFFNAGNEYLPKAPSLPEECLKLSKEPISIMHAGVTWYRPATLTELLSLKKIFPEARLITGNTEVGIETRFKNCDYRHYIHTTAVEELGAIETDADATLRVGGSVTLAQLEHHIDEMAKDTTFKPSSLRAVKAVSNMLKWFASSQIRNVASLAGNLCTASPISDMNPVLLACGAIVEMQSSDGGKRSVAMQDFFLGYRRTAVEPSEVVISITIPGTREHEYVQAYKQAKRRDDDISIVNACFRCAINPITKIIDEFHTGFGGLAPTTIRAKQTETIMMGLSLVTADSKKVLVSALTDDLILDPKVPGGMAAYRTTLGLSFAHKFIAHIESELGGIDSRDVSLPETFISQSRPLTSGVQSYQYDPCGGGLQQADKDTNEVTKVADGKINGNPDERGSVGGSIMHRSALIQCTGEATYCDDIPSPNRTQHGSFVLSDRPNGNIVSIDASEALAFLTKNKTSSQDVAHFFSAKDLTRKQNELGPIHHDEELFRSKTVTSSGQPIGIIVGPTAELARRAALLVKVEYSYVTPAVEASGKEADGDPYSSVPATQEIGEDGLPLRLHRGTPVISIDDAVREGTLSATKHVIRDGDPEKVFHTPDTVTVEGTFRIGGQEHFYLECMCALAMPGEGGSEMTVYTSSQTTTKTQRFAAQVTGLHESRIVCRVKRMGGAFGGKESRTVFVSTAASLAAHQLKRPVRINLDRDQDMWSSGTRHPFKGIYKVCASKKTGKLLAVDVDLYSNVGYSHDLSQSIMDRALFHCENCYKIPHVNARGSLAFTNTVTNTAFRGFGGPQGMLVCETYIEHIANALGMPAWEVRKNNLYKEGELTHFSQPVVDNPLQRLWEEVHSKCEISNRRAEIEKYNNQHRWYGDFIVV
jgi:xanthine dehydrogenase/oxidase